MMFQDPYASLDPRMRVQAILREPLQIQRIGSRREQDQKIRTLLDDVGLPENALERYPHEFSGGQRQRIALARALMLEPKVIVADEPVSALDVSIRSQVLNLMRRLQAEHQRASVVISHDLAVVKYLADRIGVMYLGKLVELGTGDDIYRRPAHPYTEALIKTIPLPDPVAERAKTEVGIWASYRARSTPRRAAASARGARARPPSVPSASRRCAGSGRPTRRPATSRCRIPKRLPTSSWTPMGSSSAALSLARGGEHLRTHRSRCGAPDCVVGEAMKGECGRGAAGRPAHPATPRPNLCRTGFLGGNVDDGQSRPADDGQDGV